MGSVNKVILVENGRDAELRYTPELRAGGDAQTGHDRSVGTTKADSGPEVRSAPRLPAGKSVSRCPSTS